MDVKFGSSSATNLTDWGVRNPIGHVVRAMHMCPLWRGSTIALPGHSSWLAASVSLRDGSAACKMSKLKLDNEWTVIYSKWTRDPRRSIDLLGTNWDIQHVWKHPVSWCGAIHESVPKLSKTILFWRLCLADHQFGGYCNSWIHPCFSVHVFLLVRFFSALAASWPTDNHKQFRVTAPPRRTWVHHGSCPQKSHCWIFLIGTISTFVQCLQNISWD